MTKGSRLEPFMEFIATHAAGGMSDAWIADKLTIEATCKQVRRFRHRRGIFSTRPNVPNQWRPEEDAILINGTAAGLHLGQIVVPGRTAKACWARIIKLRNEDRAPRPGESKPRRAPNHGGESNNDFFRFREALEKAAKQWDELLWPHYPEDSDRKPFAATEDGDPDPGDRGFCDLPRLAVGVGSSSMGWVA